MIDSFSIRLVVNVFNPMKQSKILVALASLICLLPLFGIYGVRFRRRMKCNKGSIKGQLILQSIYVKLTMHHTENLIPRLFSESCKTTTMPGSVILFWHTITKALSQYSARCRQSHQLYSR